METSVAGGDLKKRTELVAHRLYLVDDLQTELDNARFKSAGEAMASWRCADNEKLVSP
jgi:hypothetical protein